MKPEALEISEWVVGEDGREVSLFDFLESDDCGPLMWLLKKEAEDFGFDSVIEYLLDQHF